jgi:hypothetical protein
MRNYRTGFVSWLFVLLCCLCSAAQAAPQVGWYWNPSESGRGFFVESQNGVTFIGAYLYDTDGHALWFVAGGPNDDPYNFTGPLYYKTGGQTLYGSYVAPGPAVIAGDITVHFIDDTHGTVTWPGGSVSIERQIFGTGEPDFPAFPGWWWNADESGSGYSLELQGDKLFIVGFMYEDDGRPVWYYTAGPMTDSVTYHGDVYQFAGGQTMGGPYKPPGAPTKIATLDLEFDALNEADVTFTEATTGTSKRTKAKSASKHLTTQFDKHGNYIYPNGYDGGLGINIVVDLTDTTTEKWYFDIVVDLEPTLPKPGSGPQTSQHYHVKALGGGQVTAHLTGTLPGCTFKGEGDFPLNTKAIDLEITQDASYIVAFDFSYVVMQATLTCPDSGDTPVAFPSVGATITLPKHAINDVDLYGAHRPGWISRDVLGIPDADFEGGSVSVSGLYEFVPY